MTSLRRIRIIAAAALVATVQLTVGVTADRGDMTRPTHAPMSQPCDMKLIVAHVPGRLDRVWNLRCDTATPHGANTSNVLPPGRPGDQETNSTTASVIRLIVSRLISVS
jgi:hypothetical protein